MWRPAERIKYAPVPGRWPSREEARAARLFSPIRIGPAVFREGTWVPAMVPWRGGGEARDIVITPTASLHLHHNHATHAAQHPQRLSSHTHAHDRHDVAEHEARAAVEHAKLERVVAGRLELGEHDLPLAAMANALQASDVVGHPADALYWIARGSG